MSERRPLLHSGQGRLGSNIVVFVVAFIIFLAGFFCLQYATKEVWWPFVLVIITTLVSFGLPMALIGRSDTYHEGSDQA